MNDDRFDDIIRSKLKNYKSNSQADWELFKSKIILSDASYDASFDSEFKDRLSNYEVQQTPFIWEDLYFKYKQQIYIRNQVIAIKSGELLILFLSLFTFFNFYDIDFFTDRIDQQIAEIEIHHEIIDDNDILYQSNIKPSNPFTESTINVKYQEHEELFKSHQTGHLSSSNTSDHDLYKQGFKIDLDITLNEAIKPSTEEKQVLNGNNYRRLFLRETLAELVPIKSIGLLHPETEKYDVSSVKIAHATVPPLFSDDKNDDWLSIISMINNNTINSPRDEIYNLDEQVLYTPGFSVTAGYSKSFGVWEHHVGVSYSRISYAPYPVKESYQSEEGINVVSLNNIRYHMMSIPLHSQVHFIRNEDWSLFGGFGVQFGLVLHEFYDISDELDVPLPVSRAQGSSTEYRSRLSEKEFTRAVFNGGTFSENIFMHARFGLGVQRHLGENIHLFLSAEYMHHMLSPLGPNRDKINVFSFGTGLKYRI